MTIAVFRVYDNDSIAIIWLLLRLKADLFFFFLFNPPTHVLVYVKSEAFSHNKNE